ncbi:MAG: exopolyphosphatase, partial [bacterium]
MAAIDCGTNSIRLLVADVAADGRLTDVTRQMRIVRLGQDVDRTRRLAPEALERTAVALREYADVARAAGAGEVRMVATSAVRDATNRDAFDAMVTAILGRPADVISGAEEAALSYAGATVASAGASLSSAGA